MKKIILAAFYIFSLLAPALVKAQTSFSLQSSPSDSITYTYTGGQEYSDNITNTSGTHAPITINWHVINTDFPADWLTASAFGICDNSVCYYNTSSALWNGTSGASHTSGAYTYDSIGTFALSLNLPATATAACHWVKVAASISGTIGAIDTITFIICQPVTSGVQIVNPENNIALYPNPAHDELNVVYDATADVKNIVVYNIIGKVLSVYKVTDNTSANLNIENIPSGIYFVRLINSHGQAVVTKKFTKQ